MGHADDVIALTELSYRYSRAVDAHDADAFERMFTPDVHLDYSAPGFVFDGRDVYLDAVRGRFGALETLHCFTNHLFEIDGDLATGSWYAVIQHLDRTQSDGISFMLGCRYDTECVRTSAEWVIRSLRERPVWSRGNPAVLGGMYPADER